MAIIGGKDFDGLVTTFTFEGTIDAEALARFTAPYEQYRDPETGLYHIPAPESPDEELARLREENARLREALIDERMDWGTMAGMMSDDQIPAERERVRQWLIADGKLPPE